MKTAICMICAAALVLICSTGCETHHQETTKQNMLGGTTHQESTTTRNPITGTTSTETSREVVR